MDNLQSVEDMEALDALAVYPSGEEGAFMSQEDMITPRLKREIEMNIQGMAMGILNATQ